MSTLNGLLNSKKELTNLLEKMPITTRTIAVQHKKDELIKKLDEIEKAIEMFSKKQVFIKVQWMDFFNIQYLYILILS